MEHNLSKQDVKWVTNVRVLSLCITLQLLNDASSGAKISIKGPECIFQKKNTAL
jgi:hypothetical protein